MTTITSEASDVREPRTEITDWTSYGDQSLSRSRMVGCDGSCALIEDHSVTVAGAAIGNTGQWMAWRAIITMKPGARRQLKGHASHWAEAMTAMTAAQSLQPGSILIVDRMDVAFMINREIVSDQQTARPAKRTIEKLFGSLPKMEVGQELTVIRDSNHDLLRRAHRLANFIRVGERPQLPLGQVSFEAHCFLYASGWNGSTDHREFLPGDVE